MESKKKQVLIGFQYQAMKSEPYSNFLTRKKVETSPQHCVKKERNKSEEKKIKQTIEKWKPTTKIRELLQIKGNHLKDVTHDAHHKDLN
jgi:hypothetical protein